MITIYTTLLYIILFSLSILGLKIFHVLYISPLRTIPGPLLGKLSGMYIKYYITQGQYHKKLLKLQNEYGPIVHFAPNRVIINSKHDADKIYSTYNFKKGVFYRAFDYGEENIFSTSDRTLHSERKKIIGKIISNKNIQLLEPVMKQIGFLPWVTKLQQDISNQIPIDFYKQIHEILFTINGQLLLSENLNLLFDDKLPILKWLKEAQIYGILSYEYPILKYYNYDKESTGYNSYIKFIDFCKQKIIARIKNLELDNSKGEQYNDILQAFLNHDLINKEKDLLSTLIAEIITGFIAGTDTTANTLTWTLKCILENQDVYNKVKQEIDLHFKHAKDEDITYYNIKQKCTYLEAVIYEAMRLYPVGAGFLPRIVPDQGTILNNHFIPGGTEVGIGSYAYNRNPDIWENPEEFVPERFLTEDKNIKLNYLPFLNGPRACIGREFAWMAMFLTLVYMFKNFDVKLPSDYEELQTHFFLVLKPKQSKLIVEMEKRV